MAEMVESMIVEGMFHPLAEMYIDEDWSNKLRLIYYQRVINYLTTMMTSSNGNIFRVTGHLCGEFTGHRWIPGTKASDAELWCFL